MINIIIKHYVLHIFIFIIAFLSFDISYAQLVNNRNTLVLDILSSKTLSGIAGDYVTVTGQIRNLSQQTIPDITTYLSLVDGENKLPVDLEDWSAEKGLYIGTIDPGQILPLNWKIHFVKAGDYSLTIVAIIANSEIPQMSSITHFKVSPKRNLNPGQVLPIALGTPVVLIFIMLILNYNRRAKYQSANHSSNE
jgi:hypothetical protein